MNSLRRLFRTTLIGGVLFLIPLVFAVVVLGKAFQIMKVVATPLGKLIPVESFGGFAIVEIVTAFRHGSKPSYGGERIDSIVGSTAHGAVSPPAIAYSTTINTSR